MTPVGWEGLGISNATMAAFFLPGAGVNVYLPVFVGRVCGLAGSTAVRSSVFGACILRGRVARVYIVVSVVFRAYCDCGYFCC